MSTRTVMIETPIPEDVLRTLQASGVFREELARDARQLLAIRFYQKRLLSLGKAARLAGLERWRFIELLSENRVPVIDYSDTELAAEFATVDRLTNEMHQ
ncbi:MAG: UPF0175 family protein [Anaerolineae bacterium]|nr:UPF0175 family protein [Anaerolineae bacterium]MDW8072545.1 UPF0175 family protein [Anaerolineae bacterium]